MYGINNVMDFDIFIIGGGVNGVAIARDAAGRGLSVGLAEKSDIGGETSAKSTKLFHGGLRYLDYFEFRLVRHSLMEREILYRNMPHIAWPLRFILPFHADMRFFVNTPASKLLASLMPWLRGRRSKWVIRFGLFLYDNIGGRKILPKTQKLNLKNNIEGGILHQKFETAYEYSDIWVQDSKLVSLLARDAVGKGAHISTRNKVLSVKRNVDNWQITSEKGIFTAKILINATGPWVENVATDMIASQKNDTKNHIRLVKGSHIVVPKLYAHAKAYFFQGSDSRIIFAIPYEQDFTLIGTTDEAHDDADITPECSAQEIDYLCDFANQYFKKPITKKDVVWHFSGIRPLYQDGTLSATAATRDYVLSLDIGDKGDKGDNANNNNSAILLNIYGGKLTTHRKMAEDALAKLKPFIKMQPAWTDNAPLAGGDFETHKRDSLISKLKQDYPNFDAKQARRLFNCYGLEVWDIFTIDGAPDIWGDYFGAGLYAAEIEHLIRHEFIQTTDDIIWRRTKLGLQLNHTQIKAIDRYLGARK